MSTQEIDAQLDQRYRKKGEALAQTNEQSVTVPVDNRGALSGGVLLSFAVGGLVLGALGATLGAVALSNSSYVAASARDAGFAAAKAETATARANTAEIYAKQIYTELNRLGYPVKTPAEDHVPQPPEQVQ